MILFSSCAQTQAVAHGYRRRWTTEGTYRDGQGGWDGRHGWDLEAVVAHQRAAGPVERLVGLWALGTLLQCWLGAQTLRPQADAVLTAHLRQWATTPRLSLWARGQFALTDPRGHLPTWLVQAIGAATVQLRLVAPPPDPAQPEAA